MKTAIKSPRKQQPTTKLQFEIKGEFVMIYRQRSLTKAERIKDPTATSMDENLIIKFTDSEPSIGVDRTICDW